MEIRRDWNWGDPPASAAALGSPAPVCAGSLLRTQVQCSRARTCHPGSPCQVWTGPGRRPGEAKDGQGCCAWAWGVQRWPLSCVDPGPPRPGGGCLAGRGAARPSDSALPPALGFPQPRLPGLKKEAIVLTSWPHPAPSPAPWPPPQRAGEEGAAGHQRPGAPGGDKEHRGPGASGSQGRDGSSPRSAVAAGPSGATRSPPPTSPSRPLHPGSGLLLPLRTEVQRGFPDLPAHPSPGRPRPHPSPLQAGSPGPL